MFIARPDMLSKSQHTWPGNKVRKYYNKLQEFHSGFIIKTSGSRFFIRFPNSNDCQWLAGNRKDLLQLLYTLHNRIAAAPAGAVTQFFCLKKQVLNSSAAVLGPETGADRFLKVRPAADNDSQGSGFQHLSVRMRLHNLFPDFLCFHHNKFPGTGIAGTGLMVYR